MKQLTIGVAILIVAFTLTFGVAAAHGLAGAATDEATVDNQHEDCEAMMGEMEDCPMADGGMMGMMHDDDMEECQERMGAMSNDCPMSSNSMMDDSMSDMMSGSNSEMACH